MGNGRAGLFHLDLTWIFFCHSRNWEDLAIRVLPQFPGDCMVENSYSVYFGSPVRLAILHISDI